MNTANERIRYLRKECLGMTTIEFGKVLGISNSGVSEIESGRRKVTDQHLRILETQDIKGKRVNVEWLRTGWGEPFVEKSREAQILSYFEPLKDLNDEFKSRFAKALAALDEKDWEIIDELVDRLKRKSAEEREKEQEDSGLLLQAAHKRTDIEIPEGVDTSDDEYFD